MPPTIKGVSASYDDFDFDSIQPVRSSSASREYQEPEEYEEGLTLEDPPFLDLPEIGTANCGAIIGNTGTAKTNLLFHIISHKNNHHYRDYRIICPEGTSRQKIYQGFPRSCFVKPEEDEVGRLIEQQKARYLKDGSTLLIIFDDILGTEIQHSKLMISLCTSCRHDGTFCLLVLQSFSSVDNIIRNSLSHFYITQVVNHEITHGSRISNIMGPNGNSLTHKEVAKLLHSYGKDRWSIKRVECQSCEPLKVFHLPKIEYTIYFEL